MYLYFNEQGKLQTSIAHGSPVRQGDSVNLYVCFDLNYFTTNGLKPIQYTLFMNSKKEGDSSWSLPQMGTLLGNLKFTKFSDSEVTYKLKDGQRYITYLFNLSSSSGFTTDFGDIELVFNFIGSDNWNQYLQDAINSNQQNNDDTPLLFGQTLGSAAEKYRNLSAKIYVEPTYGKTTEVSDGSETEENFELFKDMLSNLAISKNIRLQIIQDDQENPTLELEARAREVFAQNFIFTGWLVVGMYVFNELNIQTLQEQLQGQIENGDLGLGAIGALLSEMVGQVNFADEENNIHLEQNFYTIQSTDLYFITGYDSMLVINGKTGKMHTLINGIWDDVSYTKAELDEFFAKIRAIFGQIEDWLAEKGYANLTVALEDYFQRITAIETNAIYDIKYHNGLIQKKIGKDGNYIPVVSNDELRTVLGIKTIENNGTFGVEYTNNELKAKNGLNSEKTTLFTANSLKEDMELDLVHNKPSHNQICDNPDYVATCQAVYNYLEQAAEGQATPNETPKFWALMRKLKALENYLADNGEDSDNIVNKLEEVIKVFENLPEDINLFDNINNIFNKIGENLEGTYFYNEGWSDEDKATYSIKGQIQELQKAADKNIVVIMRYEDNQELFTLDEWHTMDDEDAQDKYPEATVYTTIQSDVFKNAIDVEIIFDKTVEQEIILGAELDNELGSIKIYAIETPYIYDLTIETIKMISGLYHMTSMSTDALTQIGKNKEDISENSIAIGNLSRDKQDKSNLVVSWSETTSDTKYPSEKLVKDTLDNMFSKDFDDFHTRITNNLGWVDPDDHSQGFYNSVGLSHAKVVGGDAQTAEDMVFSSIMVTDGVISADFRGKTNGTPFVNTLTFDYEGVLKLNGVDYSDPFVKRHFEGIYNSSLSSTIDIIEENNGNYFKIVNKINSPGYNFGSMFASTPEDIEIFATSDIRDVTTGNVVSTGIIIAKDAFQVNSSGIIDFYGTGFRYNNNDIFTKNLIAATFTNNVGDDTKVPSAKLVKDSLDALDSQKQNAALVTNFNDADNAHYPSAKLVKDSLDAKASYSQTTATITNETSITPPKDVLIVGVVKNKVVKIGDLNLVDLDYSCQISNNGWGATTYYIVVIRINLPIEINGKYPVTIIVDGVSETQQVQFTSNSTTHTTEGVATKRVDNIGDYENFEFELLMHEILF